MILLDVKSKKFSYCVEALRGQYGDLKSLIYESNKEIFTLRKKDYPDFKRIKLNNIQIGRFYLINYEYNGNKIFCPIMTIDLRISDKNKPILYAVNLDYLPFDYKKIYFNMIYNKFEQYFLNNVDANNVLEENSLPFNFEMIYKSLQTNGEYQYAITAYDIKKINECNLISTNLLYLLMHVHMRNVNIALLKENMKIWENDENKSTKINYTIEELQKLGDEYDNDVKLYYKKLKALESNYKLFENE